jgi:hypothetical protein
MTPFRSLRSFLRQPPAHRRILAEATLALLAARLLLRLVPFRNLSVLMNYPLSNIRLPESERTLIRGDIARSISRAAAHLPGETVCFPRALVAQFMCRRRGIDATIFYGAAVDGKGLAAHVWVQDGCADVVGCEDVGRFQVLARFPA